MFILISPLCVYVKLPSAFILEDNLELHLEPTRPISLFQDAYLNYISINVFPIEVHIYKFWVLSLGGDREAGISQFTLPSL